MVFSAAVIPDAAEASAHRLQDWRRWLEQQLLDVVCPMAYATDSAVFRGAGGRSQEGGRQQPDLGRHRRYRLSSAQTIENIRIARKLGAAGVVLFSYDSMMNLPKGIDYLVQVSKAAFGK